MTYCECQIRAYRHRQRYTVAESSLRPTPVSWHGELYEHIHTKAICTTSMLARVLLRGSALCCPRGSSQTCKHAELSNCPTPGSTDRVNSVYIVKENFQRLAYAKLNCMRHSTATAAYGVTVTLSKGLPAFSYLKASLQCKGEMFKFYGVQPIRAAHNLCDQTDRARHVETGNMLATCTSLQPIRPHSSSTSDQPY